MASEFRQNILYHLSEIRQISNNSKYLQWSKMFLGNFSIIYDNFLTTFNILNRKNACLTVIYFP